MKSSAKKVELAPYDDLFSTEESRQDAKLEKVREIPLSELHPFKNHPFKVKDDEAMMETADSVRQYGVLVPAIARPDPEGGYELVAGHRRHRASELAEQETMPVIVRDLDNDAATIIMVDSNLQRESLLPSERAFDKLVKDRMNHQQEREQAFLSHKGDCYAIYQVKHTDELRDIRYEGLEWIKSIGRTVQRDNYDLVYTAPLAPGDLKGSVLDNLEYRFNNEHPADYRHPSMSVSDIVAIKRDGKVSYHYCDSFGFEQVPGFLPDNPLKNAEMTVEDDYGMIDGILNNGQKEPTVAQLEQQARSGQPISLMDLAAAAHREDREKKKSVMEQLKSQPKTEHKKAAPKKSTEREI